MGQTVGQSNFTSIVTSGVRPDDAGGTVTMHNRLASGQRLELGGTGTYIKGDGTTLTMVYINLVQTIGAGGDWTLTIADATVAAQEGGDITMTAGKGFTTGTGGDFVLTSGAGGTTTGAGGDFSITAGAGGDASGAGGNVSIAAGAGTAGDANGGNVTVLAGNAQGAGTDGTLGLGTSNTSAVNIGATGITTTNTGALTVTQTFTANGDSDFGNAATDTVSFTAVIDSDVTFIKEVNRTLKVGGSTTVATVGANLTIAAGDGTAGAANNGGNLALNAGNSGAGGVDGLLQLGTSNTSAITLGASTITTTSNGPLTVTETLTANGDTDIGSAATDTLSITSVIDTNVAFIKEANRTFGVAASTTAATVGANLTIYAGDGTAGAANNGGNLALNAGNAGAGGVDGLVQVGTSNTSAITLGASTITTTSNGPLTVTETLTANGDTDIGNAVTDTLTITSAIDGDIVLIKEANRDFGVATSTTAATVGANLTVHAGGGTAGAANNGGDLSLRAGLAGVGGTNGIVRIGDSNTSSVIVTPATTFSGAVSVEGDVDLGNAATDTVSFTAVVDTNITFLKEVARTIKIAASTTADTVGANLTISAADGVGVAAGGDLQLDAGSGPGAGADGVLKLGTVNTSAITIGAAGITATSTGSLTVSETFTANGNTDIGNAVTDTLTILSAIDGDVVFLKEAARDVGVATSTTLATVGANLTIHAGGGTAGAANNGGDLYLRAGLAGAGGTNGLVRIGDTNTSSVIVTPSTTFSGAVSIEGNVDLGNAATDSISFIGQGDTDITFVKEVNRIISVDTSTTLATAGADLSIIAGAGTAGAANNGGALRLRGGAAGVGGVNGTLELGVNTTGAVSIGASGVTATSNGPLTVTETFTANGDIDLGSAAADTISLTGTVDTDVSFAKGVNRIVSVAATTMPDTAGADLDIAAGAGNGTGNGGRLRLKGGLSGATGADGNVEIGDPTATDAEVYVENALYVNDYFRVTNYSYTEDFDTVAGALGAPQNQRWVGAGTNGTQTITADIGGTVRLATTAVGGSTSTLTWSQAQFHTNSAPRMFCRVRTTALTNRQIIAGWRVDANDYLYFTFDTAVSASQIFLESRNNGAAPVQTDTTVALTANDYFEFELQIAADESIKAFINGARVNPGFLGTIRELGTFVPYFYIDNKAIAQDNLLDIDVVVLGQEREA